MASLVCSALVLLATFYLLPALYFLPRSVLSAVLAIISVLSLSFITTDTPTYSIALIVFSLLAETPHDLAYFWR